MNINKEKTTEYYKTYKPCSCYDCRNYCEQIKEVYPEVCVLLESFGIDPLKPFELIPFDKDKNIEYVGCMYVVFGIIEDNYSNKIKDVKFQINKVHHPYTGINEEHFVLDFGTIILPNKYKNFIGRCI